MTKFLVRSFSHVTKDIGEKKNVPLQEVVIEEINCPSGKLPRVSKGYESIGVYQNGNSFVPWAVTSDDRVVYAQTGGHSGWNSGRGLRKYDSIVSHSRRRLCESQLGMIALSNASFTSDAVTKVSAAMKVYLTKQFWKDQQATKDMVFNEIGHYFFTHNEARNSTGKGFGRISETSPQKAGKDEVWQKILTTLTSGRLEQVMAIHDAVGRKIVGKVGGAEQQKYDSIAGTVRQWWFDKSDKRGRVDAPTKATATNTGGTVSVGDAAQVPGTIQARDRGVDMFTRDYGRTRVPGADAYYDDVDARHLLFGAGISGTTGTLLQAATAFGKLNAEEMKQYVLAIVGYLVGGGMHSYHETMAVAQKAGVPYTPGRFIPSLPQKFLNSIQFRRWHEKYYDIVELGAIHWMYNTTSLPSHMNKHLKCATCGLTQHACGCRR